MAGLPVALRDAQAVRFVGARRRKGKRYKKKGKVALKDMDHLCDSAF